MASCSPCCLLWSSAMLARSDCFLNHLMWGRIRSLGVLAAKAKASSQLATKLAKLCFHVFMYIFRLLFVSVTPDWWKRSAKRQVTSLSLLDHLIGAQTGSGTNKRNKNSHFQVLRCTFQTGFNTSASKYLHISRKPLCSSLPARDVWFQSPWLLWLASPDRLWATQEMNVDDELYSPSSSYFSPPVSLFLIFPLLSSFFPPPLPPLPPRFALHLYFLTVYSFLLLLQPINLILPSPVFTTYFAVLHISSSLPLKFLLLFFNMSFLLPGLSFPSSSPPSLLCLHGNVVTYGDGWKRRVRKC